MKLNVKEQLRITQYKMTLRKAYKQSSILELEIALDELQKELERRKK